LVILLSAGPSPALDWYVDQNSMVADPDGSPNRPYLVIQHALDDPFFQPGDRVLVKPGTYVENVNANGVEIHLLAVDGPAVTTIDGGGLGSSVDLSLASGSSITGFTITGGSAQFGGGIALFGTDSATITRNVITGNSAVVGAGLASGGGIDGYNSDFVTIQDNLVVGNHADGRGGGIQLENCHTTELSFNTVVGNHVGTGGSSYGAGVALWFGSGSVRNNVVVGNTSDVVPPVDSGGLESYFDGSVIEGNLLFQNTSADLVIDELAQSLPDASGNMAADPRFVDEVAGNYRLLLDSPAVEAAVAGVAPSPEDLDGNPRPLDADADGSAVADRGCYENLGSLENLVVSTASVFSWDAAFAPPDAYHVYRGTLAGLALGDAGACQDGRDPDLLDTEFPEPDVPALGEVFTFLAGFELDGADSALDLASDGSARRPATFCP
jgi:hypothetical protein